MRPPPAASCPSSWSGWPTPTRCSYCAWTQTCPCRCFPRSASSCAPSSQAQPWPRLCPPPRASSASPHPPPPAARASPAAVGSLGCCRCSGGSCPHRPRVRSGPTCYLQSACAKSQRGVSAGPSPTGAGRDQDKLTSGSQFVKDMLCGRGEAAGSGASELRGRPRTQRGRTAGTFSAKVVY